LLQKYLHENSFYSLDEYFEFQVKFWHTVWIDTRGPWDKCSFSLLTSLHYKYVSIYIQPLSVTHWNFQLKEYL
jgi:hypothetical protein